MSEQMSRVSPFDMMPVEDALALVLRIASSSLPCPPSSPAAPAAPAEWTEIVSLPAAEPGTLQGAAARRRHGLRASSRAAFPREPGGPSETLPLNDGDMAQSECCVRAPCRTVVCSLVMVLVMVLVDKHIK